MKFTRSIFKDEKGQSALEYILIVAGVLIIALLVYVFVMDNFFKQSSSSSNETTSEITDALRKARGNS